MILSMKLGAFQSEYKLIQHDEFLSKDFTTPSATLMTEFSKSYSEQLLEPGWKLDFVRCNDDECEFKPEKRAR